MDIEIEKKWTKEEDEIIRKEYPYVSTKIISGKLNRNFGGIYHRAYRLGVQKKKLVPLDNLKKLTLTETEKAYIGGIVDGEGSISIFKQGKKGLLYPCIVIANTNLEFLEKMKGFLTGKIRMIGKYGKFKNKNWKTCYGLFIRKTGDVEAILKEILSYLIIKKQHAELVLRHIEIRKTKDRYSTFPLLQEEIEIYNKLRDLNKRGGISGY